MPPEEGLMALKVLLVDDELASPTAAGRATRALVEELQRRDVVVITALSAEDGMSIVVSDPSVQCVIIDWVLDDGTTSHSGAEHVIELVRAQQERAHFPDH